MSDTGPVVGAWGAIDGVPLHIPSYRLGQESTRPGPNTITFLDDKDDAEEALWSYLHDAILYYLEEHVISTDHASPMAEAVWADLAGQEVKANDPR